MATFRLQRSNDVDLEFEGEVLGHATSRTRGAPRWTEINIYVTRTGKYVVERIGKTTLRHETDRHACSIVDNPTEIRKALMRKDEIEYLTYVALDALEMAAERDPKLKVALVEKI